MRKFHARWWVADPLAQYRAECAAIAHDVGISLNFIREWKPDPFELRFLREWRADEIARYRWIQ